MKAKFGKLSIGCVVASVAIMFAYVSMTDNLSFGTIVFFVFPVAGFRCVLLSARKRESPKCYRYIGFFLNLAWLLTLLSFFLG